VAVVGRLLLARLLASSIDGNVDVKLLMTAVIILLMATLLLVALFHWPGYC
jgi:hypothetical protein